LFACAWLELKHLVQAGFDNFHIRNIRPQKQVRPQTFEGEAEIFLKN
jgi:hypothetical protein